MTDEMIPRRFDRDNLLQAFKKVRWTFYGQVSEIVGTIIEAILPNSPLGTIVEIEGNDSRRILAEVVGFAKIVCCCSLTIN